MNKGLIYIMLIVLAFVSFIYFYPFVVSGSQFADDVLFLLCGQCLFFVVYAIGVKISPDNLMQPLHIMFFFYMCIFFLTPLFLITGHEADCHGVNVMGGCKFGTVLTIIGFISYLVGYCSNRKVYLYNAAKFEDVLSSHKRKKLLRTSYWIFCFFSILNLLLLFAIGYNVVFLFTFGGEGLAKVTGLPDNLRFLFNTAYILLVPWLFICAYTKKKWIVLLSTYFLVVIFFAYGWRFIIYIVAISGAVIYYRTHNKKPQFHHILLLGLILFVYSTIGEMLRGSMRSGERTIINKVETDNYLHTLESNFDIYKTYYGIVNVYPNRYDFYLGQATFISPIVMWVPRFIWADKPIPTEYPTVKAIMNGAGEDSIRKHAMACPNLGEYYIDFGIIGVVLFSLILGIISRRMLHLYYSNSIYGIIKYAMFCGFLIQLINRGYMAQLSTLFVILYIPLLLYRKYYK